MPNIKPISDLRNYTDVLHERNRRRSGLLDEKRSREIRHPGYSRL